MQKVNERDWFSVRRRVVDVQQGTLCYHLHNADHCLGGNFRDQVSMILICSWSVEVFTSPPSQKWKQVKPTPKTYKPCQTQRCTRQVDSLLPLLDMIPSQRRSNLSKQFTCNIFVLLFDKMLENFIQEYTLNGLKLMPSISPAKIKVKCLFKLPKKPGIMKFLCPHKMNTNFKQCFSLMKTRPAKSVNNIHAKLIV